MYSPHYIQNHAAEFLHNEWIDIEALKGFIDEWSEDDTPTVVASSPPSARFSSPPPMHFPSAVDSEQVKNEGNDIELVLHSFAAALEAPKVESIEAGISNKDATSFKWVPFIFITQTLLNIF